MKTVFLRALEAEDKAAALRAAIHEPQNALGKQWFEVDSTGFSKVPSAPFAYWASDRVLDLFVRLPSIATAGRIARTTNPTTDDFRFARAWWEPASSELGLRWRAWNKGGGFSPYYRDIDLVVDWDEERSTYRGYLGTIYRPDVRPANLDYFFRPGLTWGYRGHRLCVQAMPAGTAISTRGNGLYAADTLLRFDLGLLNCSAADTLIKLTLGRGGHPQFDIGDLSNIPIPEPDTVVCQLARRAWSLKRHLDIATETSHAFTGPALLHVEGDILSVRAGAWAERTRNAEAELAAIQAKIDKRCFELYGIDEADQRSITEGFGGSTDESEESDDTGAESDTEDDDNTESRADRESLVEELVSWGVGAAFGRFDIRLATSVRELPLEPEPFDRLPVCSLAMLAGDDGLPLTTAPTGYPVAFPEDGILVDDRGHARDLTGAVRVIFDKVFTANADAWWNEIGALLDPKGHDLRAWLAASFFQHHLRRHSKSRRKAPILWQLAVPSGRYSIWLYAHRLTTDSFFQIQNDVVTPKLAHEERQLASLTQGAGTNPSAMDRKEIASHEAFVDELRQLLDEVKRVAPLWIPSLDDGVVLTMSPLWRLVPQHKTWQKELKSKWDELAAGKYDWADIAMHLWPERVVPKCSTDRSLAIAHGLEDVFWVEGADGKWKPRSTPSRTVDELILERSSPAVKSSLKILLESPDSAPASRRRRSDAQGGALS